MSLNEIFAWSIFTVFVILLSFYVYLKNGYSYWDRLGILSEKPKLLFGNMKDLYTLKRTEPDIINEIYDKYKGQKMVGIYYLWKPSLLVLDPNIIKSICVTDFEYFMNHPILCSLNSSDKILWSLFLMRDELWKDRRTILNSLFTPKRLKGFFRSIEASCHKILTLLDKFASDEAEVELESVLQRYAIDVITSTLFGIDSDAIENANSIFIKCGKLLGNPSISTVLKTLAYQQAPNLCGKLGIRAMDPKIWEFFHKFVVEVVEYREKNKMLNDDLLGTIIKLKNGSESGDSIKMTIEEITGHVYVFFDAGYDTTTLAISYCLYELSLDQEIQTKLRDEVDRVLAENNGILNYESVQAMTYMDQVIAETLRKYPPVGTLKRECKKDYILKDSGVKIPKGMHVILPAASLNNDPKLFPNPQKFDPGRFSPENKKFQSTNYAFGVGPRICIGRKMAELEIKIAVAKLLKKYEFIRSDQMVEPIKFDPRAVFITNRPVNGIWVKIKQRDVLGM